MSLGVMKWTSNERHLDLTITLQWRHKQQMCPQVRAVNISCCILANDVRYTWTDQQEYNVITGRQEHRQNVSYVFAVERGLFYS
jgi:hypothetical protein